MEIPLRTAWLCIVAASCCAFFGGRAASIYYLSDTNAQNDTGVQDPPEASPSVTTKALPFPVLPHGKKFPKAKYTSKHFSETVSDYENLHIKDMVGQGLDEECFFNDEGKKECIIDRTVNSTDLVEETASGEGGGKDDEHLPAGQHLLVDIQHVDGAFLNSEHLLAKAMVDVVTESKLTLLSYHCHKLQPIGVSCVGVLLESHISFHTWPEAGVITLDLFTCGSGILVPVVPIIEKLFAVPKENINERETMSMMKWRHQFRGFRKDNQWGNLENLAGDLGDSIMSDNEYFYRKEVAWARTKFQRLDIYDTIWKEEDYDRYLRSLANDGSYESLNPRSFRPQRTVYLDGVLQSTRRGLEAYHEALVQPVMFSHVNPRRVAIIGGGEGATLREVLKHKFVDVVKMIEIDEEMVKVSRDHLPEWNGCSDLIGSEVEWCGDDSRAELYYEDAIAWFKNRFSEDRIDSEEYDEEPFDVMIMDALDPQDNVPFAKILYTDEVFVESLYDALSDDGVMVFQLGGAPYGSDPPDEHTWSARRKDLIKLLEDVGFVDLRIYQDANCGFSDAWVFLIASKSEMSRSQWFMSAADLEVEKHWRLLRTNNGIPALQYFDSGVMSNYRYPHKAFESIYCASSPTPKSCFSSNRFRDKQPDVPLSDFEVRMSSVGDGSGRGVFTKVDIKKGSTIARQTFKYPVLFPHFATGHMYNYYSQQSKTFQDLFSYVDGYGYQSKLRVSISCSFLLSWNPSKMKYSYVILTSIYSFP